MRLAGTKLAATHQYRGFGDQLYDNAGQVPSLDLRFADNKSLVDATTGQSLVTFTRASSGTFVGSDGLIKTATTNLLLRSEEFDNASWTLADVLAFGSGSVANAAIAPNGTMTADKIVESTTTAFHYVWPTSSVTVASGQDITVSVYAKAAGRSRIGVFPYSSAAGSTFNLSNGTVISAGGLTASIVAVGDGWYRCSARISAPGTTARPWLIILNDSSATNYTGDGTSGIYLWGAQLEQSSTVGEYIPTTSTINSAPRFDHNPTTGESLGLLVEEQRTNLMLRSEEFDNASWTKSASSVVANNAAAPDGNSTAEKLVEDSATSEHFTEQTFSTVSGTTYTFSVHVKSDGTKDRVALRLTTTNWSGAASNQVRFDLVTGAGTIVAGTPTWSATALRDGWWRLSISSTSSSTSSAAARVHLLATGGTAVSYTGNGTSGLFIWGAQLEAGAFPTSYIPTTTATVTRSADVASITGTNFSSWYRQDQGSFFASYTPFGVNPSSAGQAVFAASDDTATDRVYLAKRANVDQSIRWANNKTGAVNTAFISLGTWQAQPYVFAGSYRENDFAASLNAAAVATDTTAELFTGCNLLSIGADRSNGQSPLNGTIRRLTYWGQRLPNSTLQTLTQ